MSISIKIIKSQGHIRTSEQVLTLLTRHPHGLGIKQLVEQLNRPPSMLLIVLKELIARKKVKARLTKLGLIYYSLLETEGVTIKIGRRTG